MIRLSSSGAAPAGTGILRGRLPVGRFATNKEFTVVCESLGIVAPRSTATLAASTSVAAPSSVSGRKLRSHSLHPTSTAVADAHRTIKLPYSVAGVADADALFLESPGACSPVPAMPPDTPVCDVGPKFLFMNRLYECKEHLRALWGLRELRRAGSWEAHKRRVLIPTLLGMPGTGKSRFARDSVRHLVESLGSVEGAVVAVWPDDSESERKTKVDFVSELFSAAQHRNLRLVLSGSVANLEREIATELLIDWSFQQIELLDAGSSEGADPAGFHLQLGPREPLDKDRVRHLVAQMLSTYDIMLVDVLKFLSGSAESAILVNLDEAQLLPQEGLRRAIELLVSPLLQSGVLVLVSISGLDSEQLFEGMDSSGARTLEIVLPLLTVEHMSTILQHLFGTASPSTLSNSVAAVLFWLGGVPRFLEIYLRAAAKKARVVGIGQLGEWITHAASARDLIDVVAMCASEVYAAICRTASGSLPADVLGNAFSLSLSGFEVTLSTPMSATSPKWSLRHCQNNQLLYYKPTGHGVGTVCMPPIVLFAVHQATRSLNFGPAVISLQVPSISMTPDDNEMQTLSAVMHRLRAARLVGRDTIRLSQLLGGLPLGGVEDTLLDVPCCFDVTVLSKQHTSGSIAAFCASVRSAAALLPHNTGIAFLNGRRASYADAIVVLRNCVLLLQEKQSIIARQQSARGLSVHTVPALEIMAEFKKVRSTRPPFVFIFVTDEAAPALGPSDLRALGPTVLVPREGHSAVLGDVIAHLRQFALADSTAREGDARATASAAAASTGSAQITSRFSSVSGAAVVRPSSRCELQ